MIDWNVRLGDILVIVSLFGAIIAYAFKAGGLSQTIDVINNDVKELKKEQKEIADILVQVAVQQNQISNQGERLNLIDKKIEDLRSGRGFIVPPPA